MSRETHEPEEASFTPALSAEDISGLQAESEKKVETDAGGDAWETKIILQRHSRYDNRFPGEWVNPTDEERASLGRLTPEGIDEAREAADERIRESLQQGGDKVDFAVVASPTYWLDKPEFGQRAIETGEIISDEIKRQLKEAGFPEDHLLNLSPSAKGEKVRESDKIVESQMFQDFEFTYFLRKKYGGQNREFWDAYNADADRLARKEAGAEGSPEAADRVNALMNTLARWAEFRHAKYPDRKTVIFVVSHHEAIEPYAQRVLGAQPKEYEPQYNDAITINIDSAGQGHTELAGRDIEVPFAKHGKAESVDSE